MTSIDEKRVYGESEDATTVLLAADLGVVAVSVSADIVGEFSVVHRCSARDVAAGGGNVAVATDEDVLDGRFEPLGFGPAVAVGFDGTDLLAAGPEGSVARRTDDDGSNSDDGEWHELGSVGDVRAIDGAFVAAEDGVYRVAGADLQHVGLDDARDVAAAGTPLAATSDGLYRLGNGWLDVLNGDFRVVSGDGERAHAATGDALFARRDDDESGKGNGNENTGGDEWRESEAPRSVADVAYGEGNGGGTYVVTESGTFLASVGDGWRRRELGVPGVTAAVGR